MQSNSQTTFCFPLNSPRTHKKRKISNANYTLSVVTAYFFFLSLCRRIFLSLMEAAQLTDLLKQEGGFTLFAPSDKAFAALTERDVRLLKGASYHNDLTCSYLFCTYGGNSNSCKFLNKHVLLLCFFRQP